MGKSSWEKTLMRFLHQSTRAAAALIEDDRASAMAEFALVTATLGVMTVSGLVLLQTRAGSSLTFSGNALTSYSYHQ